MTLRQYVALIDDYLTIHPQGGGPPHMVAAGGCLFRKGGGPQT